MRRIFLLMLLLVVDPSLAQQRRSPDTIFMFGNWRIDLIKENQSLQLVGLVTEGRGAYFAVQCFAEGDNLTIMVPFFDVDEVAAARRRNFVEVTAWNEQGNPTTIPLFIYQDAAGIISANMRKPDRHTIFVFQFMKTLREAKVFFALEAGGSTRTYDAKHLAAARSKFDQSCAEIKTDWEGFARREMK